MAKETIIRENPIITIVNLSKYITSDSKKKETILRKIKFSDTPLYARYSGPKSAINKYLKDKERNIAIFDEFIKKEEEKRPEGIYKVSDKTCSLETLKILKSKSQVFFVSYANDYSKKGLKKQFTHLYSEGVDVSLSPDFAIYDNKSNKLTGFVKINFAKDKNSRLTYAQGHLITGLIKDHLEEQFNLKLDRRMCIALDVFAEKVILAPEDMTWAKDKPKLEKAFKEIASVWPYIQQKVA